MKKKSVVIILSIIVVLIAVIFTIIIMDKKKQEKIEENNKVLLNEINSHYNDYVKTNKETKLYKKENNKYIEYGKINKGINLILTKTNIDLDTEYFNIKDFDLYIKYGDVEKAEEYQKSDRYKNYIYFNSNVVTKNVTNAVIAIIIIYL